MVCGENDRYDVIVVGAGNATLSAALAAREHGARVLVLEKANEAEWGDNSVFTAGFRFVHDGLVDLRADVLVDLSEAEARQIAIPPFSADAYMQNLLRVTEGLAQLELADRPRRCGRVNGDFGLTGGV